jgi:hypothetical protein
MPEEQNKDAKPTMPFSHYYDALKELLNGDNVPPDLEKMNEIYNGLRVSFHGDLYDYYHERFPEGKTTITLSEPNLEGGSLLERNFEECLNNIKAAVEKHPKKTELLKHLKHMKNLHKPLKTHVRANKRLYECQMTGTDLKGRPRVP